MRRVRIPRPSCAFGPWKPDCRLSEKVAGSQQFTELRPTKAIRWVARRLSPGHALMRLKNCNVKTGSQVSRSPNVRAGGSSERLERSNGRRSTVHRVVAFQSIFSSESRYQL